MNHQTADITCSFVFVFFKTQSNLTWLFHFLSSGFSAGFIKETASLGYSQEQKKPFDFDIPIDLLYSHSKWWNYEKNRGWPDDIAVDVCAEFYLNIALNTSRSDRESNSIHVELQVIVLGCHHLWLCTERKFLVYSFSQVRSYKWIWKWVLKILWLQGT